MPPICRVCKHPQRKSIDAALLDEATSLRDVEAKYGIPIATLHRHKVKHQGWVPEVDQAVRMKKENAKRAEMAAASRVAYLESKLPSREELSDVLESVVERLDAIVARNETEGGVDAIAISGLSNIRQTISELGKIAGHVGSGSQTQVNVGVSVNLSANDIAKALSQQLIDLPSADIREVLAGE